MKRFKFVLLIAWGCITLQNFAMAENQDAIVASITRLAHVNDWMDDDIMQEVIRLRAAADENFPIYAQIIGTSMDDAVINTALSFASYAPDSRRVELSDIASQVLSKRDPSLFPSATQRALAALGASGDKRHIPQVKELTSNPQLLIRTAAESALANLENSQKNASVSADQLPSTTQPPSPKKPTEQKPAPSTPVEESPVSPRWPVVAAVVVATLGLLWVLLKKRK